MMMARTMTGRRMAVAMLLLASMTACSTTTPAQRQAQSRDVPSLSVNEPFMIQPQHLDMGTVIEGQPAHARLLVRNTGMLPLHIASVESSCGCTVGSLGSHEVPPGSFTTLDIRIDTTGKGEAVEKKVSVVDVMGRRADAWLRLRVVSNPHLGKMAGQGIFRGKCAACHAGPAAGKVRGEDIYAAVCVMCHGKAGRGGYAPRLRGLDAQFVRTTLQDGINSRMPAFSTENGGPLTAPQIAEVARWLSGLDE